MAELTPAQLKAAEDSWRSTKPWITDEWMEWWKGLDHSNCGYYGGDTIEETLEQQYWPGYLRCRSMHCPDCEKPTGSQGHRFCPEREKKKAANAEK